MNYYLINAIGLASTAFQAPRSPKSLTRGVLGHRGGDLWPSQHQLWMGPLSEKTEVVALGHLTSQPESENLTRGKSPAPNANRCCVLGIYLFDPRGASGAGEIVWEQDSVT